MSLPSNRRLLPLLLLVAFGLGVSALLRWRILGEREALELIPRIVGTAAVGARGAIAERQVALLSAGLGVVRPLAIDFLWLRAIHLQERGEYFEVASLSSLITGLEPRLAEVWTFQARNLAYNVPPSFAAAERYPWVLKGISLLRDDALLYNPGHPSIHLDLAVIFLHKIGLDFDEAGPLYRSRLALTFDVERDSAAATELWRAWKLDRDRVRRLEDRLKSRLDFRVAAAHAYYWASKGLEEPSVLTGWLRSRLEEAQTGALFQLVSSGRPVKSPQGRDFAFLPDLSLEAAAEAAIQINPGPQAGVELNEALGALAVTGVIARLIAQGEAEARTEFVREQSRLAALAATFEDLVARWATVDSQGESLKTLERAALDALDAACLLEAAREPGLAAGMRRLALVVWRRWAEQGAATVSSSFEAALEKARSRAEAGAVLESLPFGLEQLAPSSRRPASGRLRTP